MIKSIGGIAHDAVGNLLEHSPSKSLNCRSRARIRALLLFLLCFLSSSAPLHEWSYPLSECPETVDSSEGKRTYATPEPQTELTTWIFDEGTFVPSTKLVGDRRYSIISDYLGTPVEAYDEEGRRVWQRELDIYGRTRIERGEVGLVPFLYKGSTSTRRLGWLTTVSDTTRQRQGHTSAKTPFVSKRGSQIYTHTFTTQMRG